MLGIGLVILNTVPQKKYSETILLRNFYVGITSWYRYVLDTLTGGNFLGTPSVEACNIIESLVGTPPINELKTKVTMEHIMERLDFIEKNLPNMNWITEIGKKLLDSSNKNEGSLKHINRRINNLETNKGKDDQILRIGKLEETMDALSTTFSLFKIKKKEAPVGRGPKFMYVPKVSEPNRQAKFFYYH